MLSQWYAIAYDPAVTIVTHTNDSDMAEAPYIASSKQFGVWATGKTEEQARNALVEELAELDLYNQGPVMEIYKGNQR